MDTTAGKQIKLLVLLVAIAALVYFAHPNPPGFALGGWFVFIGVLTRIWTAGHLASDNRLTTSGPYEFSRNPFYLGTFVILLGFAIMSGISSRPAQIVFVGAMVFLFGYYLPLQDRREEERLSEIAGDQYRAWKAQVPMFIPRLTPYRMNPKRWSRHLFLSGSGAGTPGREWHATALTLAIAILLFVRMVKFQGIK